MLSGIWRHLVNTQVVCISLPDNQIIHQIPRLCGWLDGPKQAFIWPDSFIIVMRALRVAFVVPLSVWGEALERQRGQTRREAKVQVQTHLTRLPWDYLVDQHSDFLLFWGGQGATPWLHHQPRKISSGERFWIFVICYFFVCRELRSCVSCIDNLPYPLSIYEIHVKHTTRQNLMWSSVVNVQKY